MNSPTPIKTSAIETPTLYPFMVESTPGLASAGEALDTARAALAAVTLNYPTGVRPLEDVGTRVDAYTWTPAPTVSYAEFDRARVAVEEYTRDHGQAQRALENAVKAFDGLLYGGAIDHEAQTSRQAAAAARLEAIDHAIEHESMTGAERRSFDAEPILAERFAMVTSPSALQAVAVHGGEASIQQGRTVLVIRPEGVREVGYEEWRASRV